MNTPRTDEVFRRNNEAGNFAGGPSAMTKRFIDLSRDLERDLARLMAENERLKTVDGIIETMREMSPQARLNIGSGWFCRGCGSLDLPCHCENDE